MSHEIETMAFVGEKPWHGLGFELPTGSKVTVERIVKAAKLDWTVSKRNLFLKMGNGEVPIKEAFALARDTDDSVLSVVGKGYKPVQNAEAFEFFKRFCDAGQIEMETAGSLKGGKFVWGLARLKDEFALKGDDEVRAYLLLLSPHVIGQAMQIRLTPVRVVCWNTLSAALRSHSHGKVFRLPHHTAFDENAKGIAAEAIGLASEQFSDFQEKAKLLAKKKVTKEQSERYFVEVFDLPMEMVESGIKREPRVLARLRSAVVHAPGADLKDAEGTWWGAFNAVTYVVDHQMGRNRGTALHKAWFGSGARVKSKALDLAVEKAAA